MQIISDVERKADMERRKDALLKLPELLAAELEELKGIDRALEFLRDPITCVECGKIAFPYQTSGEMQRRMIDERLCFNCCFWTEWMCRQNEPETARINGWHYRIGKEMPPTYPSHLLGSAGRRFAIVFPDGRVVVTHNLWCQGQIPEHFRERLPDNARFGE